jgi:hypothetical protein
VTFLQQPVIAVAAQPTRNPDTSPERFGHLWIVPATALLSVVVPLLVVTTVPDVDRSAAWVITLAICCWAGVRLSWIIATRPTSLYEFMFWLFTYIFLGLAPTVQIRTGELSATTPGVSAMLDMPTALLVLTTLAAFELGRLFMRRPRRRLRESPIELVQLGWGVWVLLGVGLLCCAYYVSQVGIGVMFESRQARDASRNAAFSDPSTAAVVSALSWIPLLIAGGACAWARRGRREAGLSGRYGFAALVACGFVLVVINPISGARYTSGTVLFALLCYAGMFVNARRARLGLAGIILAFLFLFPIADAFRRTETHVSWSGFFAEYAGNPDYDGFWQIANAMAFVMRDGVVWGRQALGVVVFWVPRSLWPDKPIDTGILLANFKGYRVTNLSAPLWAEAYINGAWVLTLVVFMTLGLILRHLDRSLIRAFSVGGRIALLGSFVPAYMLILLRGSLLQATGAFWVMLAAVFVAGLGARRARLLAREDVSDGGLAVAGRHSTEQLISGRGPDRGAPRALRTSADDLPQRSTGDLESRPLR